MATFYEVATLHNPADQPFALIRIDTDKRIESGVEGVVVSLHWSQHEAKAAADLAASEVRGCS